MKKEYLIGIYINLISMIACILCTVIDMLTGEQLLSKVSSLVVLVITLVYAIVLHKIKHGALLRYFIFFYCIGLIISTVFAFKNGNAFAGVCYIICIFLLAYSCIRFNNVKINKIAFVAVIEVLLIVSIATIVINQYNESKIYFIHVMEAFAPFWCAVTLFSSYFLSYKENIVTEAKDNK